MLIKTSTEDNQLMDQPPILLGTCMEASLQAQVSASVWVYKVALNIVNKDLSIVFKKNFNFVFIE